ncbi:hypothetical protein CVT25_007288 [Psilocybe cyanescens]|uniref:Uncharacterized protein n=1 Tax=Psilocybe cyanescens TaxID=93625 RepID=A0A409XPH2_PSICY|nr:hypothetical protein CVT25_007288 [Psilocybe cyanescens]
MESHPTISRGTVRCVTIVAGLILFYFLVLDTMVRPPVPQWLSFTDLDAADMGVPQLPLQSNSNGTSAVLIVSAMFPLEKSKHSKQDYEVWLKSFLGPITTDIYMFTTPELADTLRRVRGDKPIVIDTSYASPFEIPPLAGLEETYIKMNDMDKEKWHHSPGLYAIWNAKPFLLESAVNKLKEETGAVYEYAFWNDGGSFRRDHTYSGWPDPARVQQVWEEGSRLTGTKKEDLLFFPIFQLPEPQLKDWTEDMGPIANPVQLSEGSFFGGSPSTIAWFAKIFYAYHDYYISQGLFVGIDQDVFNALFLLYPQRMFTVWMNDPDAPAHQGVTESPSLIPSLERGFLGECGAEWYYYQFWLADYSTRNSMRRMWMKEERWRKSGWWKERTLCRLTRARSMMDILRTSFGVDWEPPRRNLEIPGQ